MKLIDLDPHFVRHEERIETWTRVLGDPLKWKSGDPTEQVTSPREYQVHVDTLAEAQGVFFDCPKCYLELKGNRGCHGILCWFMNRGVPDHAVPCPGRWIVVGTGLNDLTFQHPTGNNSVKLTSPGGCDAHFHIANGEVIMCPK